MTHKITRNLTTLACALAITACSGGGSSSSGNASTDTSTTYTLSGAVTAPSGSIAFNNPTTLQHLASALFGNKVHAAIDGVTSVGAGVTVELIEIDADGNKVGDTIESTTTDSDGKYTLKTVKPASSKYIIRISGTTESMDVRYSGTTNDVDPASDAVSDLITSATDDLTKISTDEVTEIADVVDGIVQNVDPSGLSATNLGIAIKDEVSNDEELSNQINSTAASESICGNVKDASAANLANMKIVVKDFGNWLTRAKTKTDSSGNYCVNVPAGDYIVGAFNYTTTSTAASEWWSTSGTKYSPIDATKVTVAAGASVTKDFALEAGARLTGTVTAAVASSLVSGAAIEGAKVTIRQYFNYFPLASKKVRANGTYILNVIPGAYRVEAKNQSRFDYASEIHDGATGTSASYKGAKVTLTAGVTTDLDFALDKGYKISGTILDGPGGNPVTGMRVKMTNKDGTGASFRMRTNKKGKYRVWLKPAQYKFESYGQTVNPVDLTASNQTTDLSTQVGKVSLTIKDADGNGVSQAKVFLTESADTTNKAITNEVTSSDGSVTLHSIINDNHKLYLRVDGSKSYASTVYNGASSISSGTNVSMTPGSTNALGTVTLPAAGTLKVIVTTDGSTPVSSYGVQILEGGTAKNTDRFISGRTLTNGEFELSIPAATYDGVYMVSDSTNCPNISVTAGATTTLNYRTDTDTCS